jgi:hypothetical protein
LGHPRMFSYAKQLDFDAKAGDSPSRRTLQS